MKKLNVSEVSKIVGGANSCLVSYEKTTVNDVTTCQQVTTCNGKYGETVTRATVDSASCITATPLA
ncbi:MULTISPECIES: DUF4762 family protein [unclassified Serratia (in: enterobacteria)]|uniref:DUF4762 family protein n=1 Tax=unclassified Serratia (in: enterobacteria) TaxID=2647522 RepID=UPI0030762833